MTDPVLDPGTLARLRQVATWDGARVSRARSTLAEVLDRLAAWRTRFDNLQRALDAADCWSGPAADAAAATVADLSRVAATVQPAFARSQEGWNTLATSVVAARALADRTLVLAAAAEFQPAGWSVSPDLLLRGHAGVADPIPFDVRAARALAIEALAEADAAGAAARRAEDDVSGLTRWAAGSPPPTAGELLAALGPLEVPDVPVGLSPTGAAAWWRGLSAPEQAAVLAAHPAAAGSLDGLPAWARDGANRLLLARALDDRSASEEAVRVARLLDARIRAEEAAGHTVQLQLLDLTGHRVVLSLGDLDTADAVALLVPGVGTTPEDDLAGMLGDAREVAVSATADSPATTVASVVWLGYRTPQNPVSMARRTASRIGGRALDAALDGLAAARVAAGRDPARTTVLAHSYGTVVVDEAADRPGALAADAVVLLGSPGMSEDAAALEAPEVYDAGTAADVISWAGWYGMPPGAPAFGSTGLPTDACAGHSEYYDTDRPTLAAIGEVVAGGRDRN